MDPVFLHFTSEQGDGLPPIDPQVRWQLRLLGGLWLSDGQQQLTRLPSRATTALLARLAMAPQRQHAREELVELLWPGVAAAVGRNRLRQALSSLKAVLEPAGGPPSTVIAADRHSVHLLGGMLACDVPTFERAVRVGDAALATALYRGELLPGAYDRWIDDERSRLAALFDRLPAPAVPTVDPAAPSASPFAAAAAARVTAPPRALPPLPRYLAPAFGLDERLRHLAALLREHRLVTLLGAGGAGKTRLAVELAHALRAGQGRTELDLVLFVSLADSHSADQLLGAVAAALQLQTQVGPLLPQLGQAWADRQALLVLDNCEQLAPLATQAVAQLLADSPQLRVLSTSRRALALEGERCHDVLGLELPEAAGDADAGAGGTATPALALFVDRARAARADFHLSARNQSVLTELVAVLDGMPLAIELAASRVRSVAPAEMLLRLKAGPHEPLPQGTPHLDLLSRRGARSAWDPRHASMQRVIAWSWDLLQADEQRLLMALTAFRGGATAAAAAAVWDGSAPEAAALLEALHGHSLVRNTSVSDDVPRFVLSEPVREFAQQRAGDEATHWRVRHRAWVLAWAAGLPNTPSLPELRAELPNLTQALSSSVADGVASLAVQTLVHLRRALEDVALPAQGLAAAVQAVALCADTPLRSSGHSVLAPLLFTAGQPEAALAQAEAGLGSVQTSGHDSATQHARALHALARVCWRSRRDAARVEALLAQAQALPVVDSELRASLLALQAFVCNRHHRDTARAFDLHSQALALWRESGNRQAVASGQYNLAVIDQSARRFQACLLRLAPVLHSARHAQDWRRVSQALNVRGEALVGLRRWPEAVLTYRECIDVAWRGMAVFDLAYGLWNLPRALAHLRQGAEAWRLMAYAEQFWRVRFAPLDAESHFELRRTRRLCRMQLSAQDAALAWEQGHDMSLAQAVALALGRGSGSGPGPGSGPRPGPGPGSDSGSGSGSGPGSDSGSVSR